MRLSRVTQVQCLRCQRITEQGNPRAASWDCACGSSYVLRRCSACNVVSQVTSLQRSGQPWNCMWCHAPNGGFAARNDPRAATIKDLGADMAKHGLAFTPKASAEPADTALTDMQPVLIVTMNEVPGHHITQVHGDVFGMVVRVRSYFGNLGASLASLADGEVTGYTKLLTDSGNQARVSDPAGGRCRLSAYRHRHHLPGHRYTVDRINPRWSGRSAARRKLR